MCGLGFGVLGSFRASFDSVGWEKEEEENVRTECEDANARVENMGKAC